MSAEDGRRIRLRKTAGYLWLAAWIGVLYAVAAPWRALGGLVDERLRWLEWCVLVTGLPLGFTIGRYARDAALGPKRVTHLQLLRVLLHPLLALTALALVLLTALGERGPIGVVVTALLAYWAGLDLAFGAVPLMEGKSYRLRRALDPERETGAAAYEQGGEGEWEEALSATSARSRS